MENFHFFTPTEIIFGKDTENETGKAAAKYGKKAFIVYGRGSAVKSGLLSRIKKSLENSGITYCEFPGAQPNPTLSHARQGILKSIEFGADIIIAVGGGSSIDTAKAIAHGSANPDCDIWDIWTKKVPLTKSLPVGAVLTIPAAGSEMSDSAVLTNTETGKKSGLNSEFNRCRFAILNPSLASTLPKYQIAAGITDIMMHTMERYFIPDIKCDLTDEIAEGLLRTVIKNGSLVIKDPCDYDAMAEVFWCSSISHNNLTECGRGKDFSVHKLGHALSARYGVTHGASLAAVWKYWAEYLYKDCLSRFSRYARKVWGITEPDDETASKEGIDKTVDYFRSIGMPVSLKDLDIEITESDIHELSLNATAGDTLRLTRIKPIGAKEVEEIYMAALQ